MSTRWLWLSLALTSSILACDGGDEDTDAAADDSVDGGGLGGGGGGGIELPRSASKKVGPAGGEVAIAA
ncbi:MAG TPA: hypothetical protein VLC09_03545, partial [Polyangiaceae bacterium]|nr:hypothetical protein [Polyangiaceae bacterium]